MLHHSQRRDALRQMCRTSSRSQVCRLEHARATNEGRGGGGGGGSGSGGGAAKCQSRTPRCSNLGTAACEEPHWKDFKAVCRSLGSREALPQSGCAHPACVRVAPDAPQYSGQFRSCQWDPSFSRDVVVDDDDGEATTTAAAAKLSDSGGGGGDGSGTKSKRARSEAFCTHSLLPWAREGELNVTVRKPKHAESTRKHVQAHPPIPTHQPPITGARSLAPDASSRQEGPLSSVWLASHPSSLPAGGGLYA